jgi:CubicO group peptidase (beta-lactamase class C family)
LITTPRSRRSLLGAIAGAMALPIAGGLTAPAARAQERAYWPTYGWRAALPAEVGLDAGGFDQVTALLQSDSPTLSAMVVAYRGSLVYEYYANGFHAWQPTDIWSSTKSITGLVTGIAIDQGLLTLDTRIGDVLAERVPAEADPVVNEITVRNLLTMRSGWLWDGTVDYANLDNAADWAARTLTLPMQAAPGELFTYNSGNTHILSCMIQAVSGQTLRDFAQDTLFSPMGVEIHDWLMSDQGESAGGWGLHITPREMVKIGYLMLNGGRWDGEQVVSESWVLESTAYQSDSTGINDFGLGTGYGYTWWRADLGGYPSYFALGYGESVIYVVPGLDLVCAAATDVVPSFDNPGAQSRPQPVIRRTLVPLVSAG